MASVPFLYLDNVLMIIRMMIVVCVCVSHSLSLSIYIYICTHTHVYVVMHYYNIKESTEARTARLHKHDLAQNIRSGRTGHRHLDYNSNNTNNNDKIKVM